MATYPPGWKLVNGQWIEDKEPSYMAARMSEPSTYSGLGTAAAGVGLAVMAGMAGDIPGALTSGVPAAIALVTGLAAVFTPEKKGPTDEEIHNSVSRMSRDQLISLLQPSGVLQATSTESYTRPVADNAGQSVTNAG